MKVLIVAQHVNFFRNLDTVMRALSARGHEVVFLHGTRFDTKDVQRKRGKLPFMARGLQFAQDDIPGVTTGYRPPPSEPWQRMLINGRLVLSRGVYYRPGHPSPERTVEGIEKELPEKWRAWATGRVGRRIIGRPIALKAWRWLESVSPPSPSVVEVLRGIAPDVMVISPTIWPKGPVEADYVAAAAELGIPSLGYLNSWDNLTSKGTVHLLPDLYLVWNEPLAEEAVDLHDIPIDRIRITGAPHLDHFFSMRPTSDAAGARAHMGCPPDRPYVIFLCSSRTIMPDEVDLVNRVAAALEARIPVNTPTLVVRPHPTNAEPWLTYERKGVVVHPKQGDQADTPAAWQAYYNQLAHAACVIGLNTTAFLEAVVANRPCLTIVADEFHRAQGRTGHFRHLLKGGFLDVSADVDGLANSVARVLDGEDVTKARRRHFVEWFIRPCGLDRPAGEVVADVILQAARPAGERAAAPVPPDQVPGLPLVRGGRA